MHFGRCGKQGEHVRSALGHYGDFRNVRAHLLHLAQAGNNIVLFRGSKEIVVGTNHKRARLVDAVDICFHNAVAGEDFNVDQVRISACCNGKVQRSVLLHGDLLLAAFLFGAEGEQQRKRAERTAQLFQGCKRLFRVKYIVIEIHAPFNCMNGHRGDLACFCKDGFLCFANDRDDDLRHAAADFYVADLDGLNHGVYSLELILPV